jgi:hypothetical protein
MTQDIETQVSMLRTRMFKHRLSQWHSHHQGWQAVEARGRRFHGGGTDAFIRARLLEGCIVTSGYYPTSCRGFHTHMVLWKNRKGSTQCVHELGEEDACRKCQAKLFAPLQTAQPAV